jgi:hypothetical protein
MKLVFFLFFLNFMNLINSGRIVGNIIHNKFSDVPIKINNNFCANEKLNFLDSQQIITNKNNLIYNEKERELFLEDNNFIKNKKLISISPGGLKGFYELGILSFIKDNYDMENYIFSGASAGAWNALFMCYKKDNKKFVFNLLDYKLTQIKSLKELEYFLKYKILTLYKNEDFDLRRLFIGVTSIKNFHKTTNIFSDFDNLEDAINCCIASSHIPFITGGLTNRYHNMYTFDGGFSNYPYLNFTENVLHITPGMWRELTNNNDIKYKFLKPLKRLNIVLELFSLRKNNDFMELYDHGYQDAKNNKHILDAIFLKDNINNSSNTNNINYPNAHLDLSKDNDSY